MVKPEDEVNMENGETEGDVVTGDARDPSGFLSEIIGAPVTVKLNSGVIYKGMSHR
jgi:U6 snRNA-associated Sm-like protein LSm6